MKILSAAQLREADIYTIKNKPISSLALMERAGWECTKWIISRKNFSLQYTIICGTGNNGGDGLVIARLLAEKKISVEVIIIQTNSPATNDFNHNLEKLKKIPVSIVYYKEGGKINIPEKSVIIDAIFGTGLTRPITGSIANIIEEINKSGNVIISIDLPSGLFADKKSEGSIIKATQTITIQSPKLAFLFPENEIYTGEFSVLNIDLDKKFIDDIKTTKLFLTRDEIRNYLKPRTKFSHKGNYGHSLLVSGSKGKIGAAVLAARACLRSGTGLLTVHIPAGSYDILQTAVPEAMVDTDVDENIITGLNSTEKYSAIGIGPGIGKSEITIKMLFGVIENFRAPMVIDADALNIFSDYPEKLKLISPNSILTPHPGEFERLAGKSKNDFERHDRQLKFSADYNVIVVLKGAYSCITTPDGRAIFNSTGNPGMAKGGSGDALTGIILAMLSQKYSSEEAAILAVYIHGLAGDYASKKKGNYSMITSDLIECLPKAFKDILRK